MIVVATYNKTVRRRQSGIVYITNSCLFVCYSAAMQAVVAAKVLNDTMSALSIGLSELLYRWKCVTLESMKTLQPDS